MVGRYFYCVCKFGYLTLQLYVQVARIQVKYKNLKLEMNSQESTHVVLQYEFIQS